MSTTTSKKLAIYGIGAACATTATSEAALVVLRPVDNFLAGDDNAESVPRAVISFDAGSSSIDYTRVNNDSATNAGALTVSPNYEFKPIIGAPQNRPGEARAVELLGFGYSAANANFEETIGPGTSFGNPTLLQTGGLSYLGVQNSTLGGNFFGWISYFYDGTNVTIDTIFFDDEVGTTVEAGIIPEPSEIMAVVGGIFGVGLIGIRKLRKKKAAVA